MCLDAAEGGSAERRARVGLDGGSAERARVALDGGSAERVRVALDERLLERCEASSELAVQWCSRRIPQAIQQHSVSAFLLLTFADLKVVHSL